MVKAIVCPGAALALALGAVPAWAQQAVQSFAPVVVTASGVEQEIRDAPASITIVTREELEKQPFRDLTDALRNVEGVSVTGVANEQDIYIRGLPGNYTLILVDGKRQNTRDARPNGSSGFEQSFIPPLEAIERIEVVRGPMSSLYGSDAMGGVINIITRKVGTKWGGSLTGDYTLQEHGDSGDSYQGQFYLNGPIMQDKLGLQLWGRYLNRDEDRILGGFHRTRDSSVTARLAFTPTANHDIMLEAGTARLRRDNTPGMTAEAGTFDGYRNHDRDHYSISHAGRYGWGTSDLALSREVAKRTTYAKDNSGDFVRNARAPEIQNTVFDAKFSVPLGNHMLVFGGQYNEAELTDFNPGLRDNANRKFSITQKAVFLEDEWQITDSFSLLGGVRLDDHEVYGTQTSPRAYAVWHTTDQLTLKGGVSRGFKAPDIRQIAPGYATTTGGGGCSYGPNGTCGVIIGDPGLEAETSTNYELSAHWDNQRDLAASITGFYTKFKDKVSNALVLDENGVPVRWSEDPNYRLWYNFNVDNATIRGVELSVRWRPTARWSVVPNYTFTDSKQTGGAYDGYPLTRTPRHAGNLRIEYTPSAALTLWTAGNYHGKEINAGARVGTNGVELAQGVREYDDYYTFDLGASYALTKNTTINAAVYNLGDKRLDEQTYNTIGDGRRYWLSVNTRF
ncbi:TonB-dependent receptor [Orrella sp. JC864]|uniref:TonB-dependent receptor domain-containing protein n=1 Tax=Orrella sp. JC864 TaxID=3120298 RepID=UPI00300914A4